MINLALNLLYCCQQTTLELPQSFDAGSELTIEFSENSEFGGDSHTTFKV